MIRRPWWDKPSWTRHVTTGPAAEATRPMHERCGLTSAEQAVWFKRAAELGVDMHEAIDEAYAHQHRVESPDDQPQQPGRRDWFATLAAFAGVALILLAIGVLP